jgi:hypothetical protein
MKEYRYKGYTLEPCRIGCVKWEVNVSGMCYYFKSIKHFKKWVNNR